eukprot:478570-Prymnesium_polylepis.1
MSLFPFSQTCREDLFDPRTPSCRRFGASETSAFDSQRHRRTRETAAVRPQLAYPCWIAHAP